MRMIPVWVLNWRLTFADGCLTLSCVVACAAGTTARAMQKHVQLDEHPDQHPDDSGGGGGGGPTLGGDTFESEARP